MRAPLCETHRLLCCPFALISAVLTTSQGLGHIKNGKEEGVNRIASTDIFSPAFRWLWNSLSTLSILRTFL